MRKNTNQENIEGRLYDYDLTMKTVQNQQSKNFGKEFISGTVSVATDDAGLNVLPIHYTYITEFTNSDKPDSRFAALKRIMTEDKTWLKVGKDEAAKIRINSSAALNDFYPQGGDQLASTPKNESGFITFVSELCPDGINRHKFIFDALITGVTLVEADEERGTEEYVKINAAIFDFKNSILPFPLVAKGKDAIKYFMGLNASPTEPYYNKVWGEIVNTTIKVEKVIEGALGSTVDVSERPQREWVVVNANPEPYEFGLESTMTIEDVKKAIQDRNVYLEEVKARAKAYYDSKGAVAAPTPTPTPAAKIPQGGFNF